MYILNFDKHNQLFEFNKSFLETLEYRTNNKDLNLRKIAKNYIFTDAQKKSNYYIFKKFIDPELAKKIRDFYTLTEMKNSFIDTGNNGNFRLFYYLNSPYIYPKFIKSLIVKLMEFKNMVYEHHDYYQNYCMINKLNPANYAEVANRQIYHSWQSIYWYKQGSKFFQHIDSYGELACFLILSKKGEDYIDGGMEITYEDGTRKFLENEYDYGDLVFLDQAQVYHEVKEIKLDKEQIGRVQIYIPTIPQHYMKRVLFFEGFEHKPYFTDSNEKIFYKALSKINSFSKKENIHYSRKIHPHNLEAI